MKTRALLVTVSMVLTTGCSMVGIDQKLYEAQRLELSGGRKALGDLIVAYTKDQRWAIVATSVTPNPAVEALSPPVEVSGMTMRNRWFFWAEDNQVLVEMRLEVRFDPAVDVWESSPVLCDTYEYQNEQRHLKGLAEFASTRAHPVLAAVGNSAVRN
jgi:hypothetical protein